MSGAVRSRLDPSLLQAMRARRSIAEPRAAEKLEILRRLYLQHVACDLPRQAETRVEQSFNEQLFARVFDYETLLSHGRVPFHLQPKTHGRGHYDDFSLGSFFGGGGQDSVFGSAELKPAGTDLDAPQAGRYGGMSPVQQAFRTALEHTTCRWVLVSNFREIRLYDVHDSEQPLVVANLHDVRNRNDLALLLAHFDRRALLPGESTEAEMITALDPTHPQQPTPAADGSYRIVFRFTPQVDVGAPLFRLEGALRDAIVSTPYSARWFFTGHPADGVIPIPLVAREGWVMVEGAHGLDNRLGVHTRVAASRFGEVQVSISKRFERPAEVELYWVENVGKYLVQLVETIYSHIDPGVTICGQLSAELRDVAGTTILEQRRAIRGAPIEGRNDVPEVIVGDFEVWPQKDRPVNAALADCICEIAIHYRSQNGGVLLDDEALSSELVADLQLGD